MTPRIDITEVERSLRYIVEPGETFEIRAIDQRGDTLSGYFRDPAIAASEIARSCAATKGVYTTLNPVKPALYSRRADRIAKPTGKRGEMTTPDTHIVKRTRIRFDFDAVPVADVSSTHAEHNAAIFAAWSAACDLVELGWPEPILEDSGNGAGLIFAINEPTADGGLVANVLAAGEAKWGTTDGDITIKIDVTNANPSRITKVHGTPCRKGDSTDERPHRQARILYAPEHLEVVTREQLEAFAGESDKSPENENSGNLKSNAKTDSKTFDVESWLAKHGIEHEPSFVDNDGRIVWVLKTCPFDPDHARGEAHVHRKPDGKLGASCKHDSCRWGWKELRLKFEPDAYESKAFDAVKAATDYVHRNAMHIDGVLLRRWRGDWYRWCTERGHYATHSDEQLKADLYRSLKIGKRAIVGEVKDALIAVDDVLVDHVELGAWLDGRADNRDPLDLAACRNGILHLPTSTIIPATPRYFATTALGVNWDAKAHPPLAWFKFLGQLWPTDDESVSLLQEWIGYLLTADTRQQKILLLLGPKRSGKGTIARVIAALIGAASVASPTLASLGTNFGLWPLIGKTAAIIGDARLGGRSDIAQVVERLLSISGEDLQTIDRKHREPWTGKLATRITIISNEPPRFTDASDALPARMLVLQLEHSFYGHEDHELTDKLTAELPGILRWAIDGWKRLRARGHFLQPRSSADAVGDLIDLASPVAAWARQRCTTRESDDKRWLTCVAAYGDFSAWCDAQGVKIVPTMTVFGRDVVTATGCKRVQVTRGDKRHGAYRGLALLQ